MPSWPWLPWCERPQNSLPVMNQWQWVPGKAISQFFGPKNSVSTRSSPLQPLTKTSLIHILHRCVCQTVFTALRGMQTRSSDKNSVRLSVCLSVCMPNACIVTKRKKNQSRFLYHAKEWPRWSEIVDFQSIFARSASAVTSSETSSIITDRKFTTRFSMNPR